MSYEVHVKQVEPSNVLCTHVTASTDRVGEAVRSALGELTETAILSGLTVVGAPEVTYLSHFRPGADVELEAGLPVTAGDGVTHRPGGQVAHVYHKGPYEEIEDAYDELFIWVHRAGYEVAGHPTEVYLVGPADTGQPEDYLTEIIIPVRRATTTG